MKSAPFGVCFFLLCLLPLASSFAQLQNNQWRYGLNGGINFNTAVPSVVPGAAIQTAEGCASVADRNTGQLLFYTDGVTVWNANNAVMLNGTDLAGGTATILSSTTAAMIAPVPGSSTQYYIFTIDEQVAAIPRGLRYSVVDMTLDGGLGGVVNATKNTFLYATTSEKLQLIPHNNGAGFWVLTHQMPNTFVAFNVSAAGIATSPVLSTLGDDHGNGAGHMKVSRQFDKIGQGNFFENSIELFDFNNTTGVVSNFRKWPYNTGGNFVYGIEFSPNGQLLYASNINSTVLQFNLLAGSPTDIANSRHTVSTNFIGQPATLQLGPDEKIYISTTLGIDRIDCPNLPGAACGFLSNAIPGSSIGSYGLPGWVLGAASSSANPSGAFIAFADSCLENGSSLSIPASAQVIGVRWNFGDPTTGSANQATGFSVQHRFSNVGSFVITAILDKACGLSDTLRRSVSIVSCRPPGLTAIGVQGDSCDLTRALQFEGIGSSLAGSFFWDFGDRINDTLTTNSAGSGVAHQFSAPGMYNVCVTFTEPGDTTKTICREVVVGNCCRYGLRDSSLCLENELKLEFTGTLPDSLVFECNNQVYRLQNTRNLSLLPAGEGVFAYKAILYNRSCTTDTLMGTLQISDCSFDNCEIFAANVFTPQGDGLNDFFKPTFSCTPSFYEFKIYNRWGQLMYQTNALEDVGWDGKFNDEVVESGLYTYTSYYRYGNNTRLLLKSGAVKVLR